MAAEYTQKNKKEMKTLLFYKNALNRKYDSNIEIDKTVSHGVEKWQTE